MIIFPRVQNLVFPVSSVVYGGQGSLGRLAILSVFLTTCMATLLSVLQTLGILILVLVIFNFIILVHEWGHFLAARWRGLTVTKFQIWFGKPIWKKTYNGVQYGLGCIPLGGFVQLPQMAPMGAIEGQVENDGGEKLAPIKPLDKIIVAFAGPLFSFLLAVVCAFVVWGVGKPRRADETDVRIGYVKPDYPAAKAGLLPGDRILAVNGKQVRVFNGPVDSVVWEIVASETDDVVFDIERDGTTKKITVTAQLNDLPEYKEWQNRPWWERFYKRPPWRKVGIAQVTGPLRVKSVLPNSPAAEAGVKEGDVLKGVNGNPFLQFEQLNQATIMLLPADVQKDINEEKTVERSRIAINGAFTLQLQRGQETKDFLISPRLPDKPLEATFPTTGVEWETISGVILEYPTPGRQIGDAFRAQFAMLQKLLPTSEASIGAGHMNSAVGIVSIYHQLFQIEHGWRLIIVFSVLLNISLAVLNLLPLPVLDGGHITLALAELIRGKTPSTELLTKLQAVCVLGLFSFMFWLITKDVASLLSGENDTKPDKIEFLPKKASSPESPPPTPPGEAVPK